MGLTFHPALPLQGERERVREDPLGVTQAGVWIPPLPPPSWRFGLSSHLSEEENKGLPSSASLKTLKQGGFSCRSH